MLENPTQNIEKQKTPEQVRSDILRRLKEFWQKKGLSVSAKLLAPIVFACALGALPQDSSAQEKPLSINIEQVESDLGISFDFEVNKQEIEHEQQQFFSGISSEVGISAEKLTEIGSFGYDENTRDNIANFNQNFEGQISDNGGDVVFATTHSIRESQINDNFQSIIRSSSKIFEIDSSVEIVPSGEQISVSGISTDRNGAIEAALGQAIIIADAQLDNYSVNSDQEQVKAGQSYGHSATMLKDTVSAVKIIKQYRVVGEQSVSYGGQQGYEVQVEVVFGQIAN